jgi:oxygen-independent coproporphyrinogen-3 oxidase
MDAYVSALLREIEEYAPRAKGRVVDTVFFGGGTPTCLPSELLCGVLECIKSHYDVSEDADISAECNPATADLEYFKAMHSVGFNRISIGIQSANENEMRLLGRIHSFDDAKSAVSEARRAGFSNVGADVMFGIPDQTVDSFMNTLEKITSLGVDHVSMYGLQLEEGTPLCKMQDSLSFPSEDDEREMYMRGSEFLRELGFSRYEISNFAKEGYHSRHNLRYWLDEEYFGFGLSAHSYFDGVRYFNTDGMSDYLSGNTVLGEDEISASESMSEYVMLAMRLERGIDTLDFKLRFGVDFSSKFGAIEKYVASGHVKKTPQGYAFSDEGMYVSNYILSEILDF